MSGLRVAASLWSVSPERRPAEARRLAEAGVRLWHWDRSDGSTAPAGGFEAAEAANLAALVGGRSEAHLMLGEPGAELDSWLAFCERIVVHVEVDGWREACDRVRAAGRQVAVAVAPGTDPAAVSAPAGAAVLVMSVVPGHAGTPFDPGAIERVEHWAVSREVGVDGGLDLERAGECRRAGARWLVSGTGLTGAEDPRAWLESVRADGG